MMQPGMMQPGMMQPGMMQPQPAMWGGMPADRVIIKPPNPNDPAFLRTAAPSGTSWGQYVRARPSFIDPSGNLAGPWAECISWATIYEIRNPNWSSMPQYQQDGVVGGVLQGMEMYYRGHPQGQRL